MSAQIAAAAGVAQTESAHESAVDALLAVEGMFCPACARAVEITLKRQPGVASAQVSFAAEAARVRYDPARADPQQLIDSIGRLGYAVRAVRGLDEAIPRHAPLERALATRLAVAVVFGMWSMGFALADYFSSDLDPATRLGLSWAQALFALPVISWCAWPFIIAGWRTLRARTPGLDTMIAVAVTSASVLSLGNLAQDLAQVYFDTAVMLVIFQLASRLGERVLRRHATDRVRELLALAPEQAQRRDEGGLFHLVPAATLQRGDVIRVSSGGVAAVDARIVRGHSTLDLALVSGESQPVAVTVGDLVPAGAINGAGVLELEVVAAVGERRLDSWARLIQQALFAKPALQRTSERMAQAITIIALVAGVIAPVLALATGASPAQAWERALATILIACPCALTLVIPLSISTAISAASRHGLLIRDPSAFERAARIDHLLFDKTGTLSCGRMQLRAVRSAMPDIDLLAIARGIDAGQSHPIARALAASGPQVALPGHAQAIPGAGIVFELTAPACGLLAGTRLRLGSARWINANPLPEASDDEGTSVWLAITAPGAAEQIAGSLLFDDTPRAESGALLAQLQRSGWTPMVLSGDSAQACRRMALALGLPPQRVQPECSPERKREVVDALQAAGGRVAFIGDGINDGMALAQADLGIATRDATESAKLAAAVVLMRDGLDAIPALLDLARRTHRVLRQSLVWAVLWNLLLIPVAMLGLISPAVAAAAMAASTLTVGLSTQRLRIA